MKWIYYDAEIGEVCREEITKQEFLIKIKKYIICILIVCISVFLITKIFFLNTKVPTISMESTINKGDMILGNRLAYKCEQPKRGDIIIFKYPDNPNIQYVKRIVGLPGETVQIIEGKLYVNNEKIEEKYLQYMSKDSCGPFVVPKDGYFVLGDNRDASEDSREWDNKYVRKNQILAKVMISYFPKIREIK